MAIEDIDDDMSFDKAVGLLRFALNKVMKPLELYGQTHYVRTAVEEIISLSVQLHWKLSGLDEMPYHINEELLHW